MIRASLRTERCLMADILDLSYTLSTTDAPLSLSQVAEYTTQSLQQAAGSRAGQLVSCVLYCVMGLSYNDIFST
jgi:hypothetical protein